MKTQLHSVRVPFRHAAMGLVFAASVVTVLPAHAGWFSNVGTKVKTTAAKVAATPGNVENKVKDISAKINEIYGNIQENRPLAEHLRNGHMMTTLKETLAFISDMREDYEQFADTGADPFRNDMKGMISNFGQISQTFGQDNAVLNRLDKVTTLMDKVPTAFLYIMHQAVGSRLENVQEKVAQLQLRLSQLPSLPPLSAVVQAPANYADSLCPLVNDKPTKVTVAVLKTTIKSVSFALKTIKDYLPDDLVVTADVVAGGGLTMSKNPSQLPFQVALTIVDSLELKIENYETIAGAVCPESK